MSSKRRQPPLEWNEIRSAEGAVIGRYAVHNGMITVQHPSGGEKTTHIGPPNAVSGLARLMLSEFQNPKSPR